MGAAAGAAMGAVLGAALAGGNCVLIGCLNCPAGGIAGFLFGIAGCAGGVRVLGAAGVAAMGADIID